MHVAVAEPVRTHRHWIHAERRLLRKEGAAKRKGRGRHGQGLRTAHRNQGVVGARAVVVPAVNDDGVHLRQPDAVQLQVVHDEAGRYRGSNPRFNHER